MKTFLLTGARGFIGTHYRNQFTKKYRIQTFSFLRDDFSRLDLSNIDCVIHLAALVHQMGRKSTLDDYYSANVQKTVDIAQKAKICGVRQFIFVSTIAVYGENENLIAEKNTLNPATPYGKSKLDAEKKIQSLEDENFVVSIIRPPLVYGENAPGNIKSLLSIVKKIPILPFNKIHNRRSFVYIGNLCDMIDRVIETRMGGIFLAADDEPVSTTKFIEMISRAMGKKTILIKIPFFETVLKLLKPFIHKKLYGDLIVDNAATKKKLNFRNRFSTEEGIRLMMTGV